MIKYKTLMTSAKVAVWSFGTWIFSIVLVALLSPSVEEFFAGGFDKAASTIQTLSTIQSIGNIALIVGIAAVAYTGYRKILDKP